MSKRGARSKTTADAVIAPPVTTSTAPTSVGDAAGGSSGGSKTTLDEIAATVTAAQAQLAEVVSLRTTGAEESVKKLRTTLQSKIDGKDGWCSALQYYLPRKNTC